ncbi:hypothetical protein FAF44_04990 [Nonomuraea sp. MG754425]|uniref:hypothetical protein n=1 Tax=Nonomuraea sp. MG754425 TaxID=2570319 RepID=UPI001F33D7F3|nr:hypothetical protein [Nonomuraea sp. MG754425]MCF6467767.1 hypothetical protein [Nonomuraea sp. MG754425]
MTGRVGRPQGRARGSTEQANALAEFLLTLTDGTTVRELAARYPVGKTLWGEYRSGEKLVPLDLLTRLVEDHTSDERARRQRLETAVRLHSAALDAAMRAPVPRTIPTTAPPPAPDEETISASPGDVPSTTDAEARQAPMNRRRRSRPLMFAGGGLVLVAFALLVPLAWPGPASAPSAHGAGAPLAEGSVFATGPGGQGVFQWDGTDPAGWTKVGESATHLWSGPAGLFAAGADNRLHKYGGRPGRWSVIGDAGHDVAVSGSGVYRLDADRKAVRVWDGYGTSWTQVGGPAARLYGGEPGLFATDPNDGRIFRYLGRPGSWEFVGTAGASFALTGGDLYGLTPERTAVNRWAPGRQPAAVLPWVQAAGPAGALYGGASGLYSTDPTGKRLRVLAPGPENPDSVREWQDIGAAGADIGVGRRGVYVLTADRSAIVRWSRDTAAWRRIGGPAQSLTVAVPPGR